MSQLLMSGYLGSSGQLKNDENYYEIIDLVSYAGLLSKITKPHQKYFELSSQTINLKYIIPAPSRYDFLDGPKTLVLGYRYPDDCNAFNLAGGEFEISTLSDNVIRKYGADENLDFIRKTSTVDLLEYSDEVFEKKKDVYKRTYKSNLADPIKNKDVSFIKKLLDHPKTTEEFYTARKLKQFQAIEKLVGKIYSNFGDMVYDITKISIPLESQSNDTELLQFLKDRTFLMLGSHYPDNSFGSAVSIPIKITEENNRRNLYSIFDGSPNQQYVSCSEDRKEFEEKSNEFLQKVEEYRSLILSRSFIRREIFTEKINKKALRQVVIRGTESIDKIFI